MDLSQSWPLAALILGLLLSLAVLVAVAVRGTTSRDRAEVIRALADLVRELLAGVVRFWRR